MNFLGCNFLFFIIYLLAAVPFSNNLKAQSYESLISLYDKKKENDESALPYVSLLIKKAIKDKNYGRLVHGYKDGIYFSSINGKKLKYADSAIVAATQSGDKDLIINAHLGKGIVYYFNYKKYKPALEEYLSAYKLLNKSSDSYLRHKVIYHLGVVKNYLGYYEEALFHFKECSEYFLYQLQRSSSPNEIYNNKKGYLNSLSQTASCYVHQKNFNGARKLVEKGLKLIGNSTEFETEKSHFYKTKGIINFYEKNYEQAIENLNIATREPIDKKDFTSLVIIDYYKGKSYLGRSDSAAAFRNFAKVDSIFQKNHFILPELRKNYEFLIKYYHSKNDHKNELYYTTSLLKADSIINRDFSYLSSRIHKEYDTKDLVDSKKRLEKLNRSKLGLIMLLFSCIIVLAYFVRQYVLKEKAIKAKYLELEKKFHTYSFKETAEVAAKENKALLNDTVRKKLLKKINTFEKNERFLEKGLSLSKLAKDLQTNESYLSQIINEDKGMNFNKYLSRLRIDYITQKLYFDTEYLKFTVETLAESCGIASRQNFSDLFFEVNGMRPKDFIKIRKNEMKSEMAVKDEIYSLERNFKVSEN